MRSAAVARPWGLVGFWHFPDDALIRLSRTGFATLGTIGFEGRFDYAAIGTVANVASRLRSVALRRPRSCGVRRGSGRWRARR